MFDFDAPITARDIKQMSTFKKPKPSIGRLTARLGQNTLHQNSNESIGLDLTGGMQMRSGAIKRSELDFLISGKN